MEIAEERKKPCFFFKLSSSEIKKKKKKGKANRWHEARKGGIYKDRVGIAIRQSIIHRPQPAECENLESVL